VSLIKRQRSLSEGVLISFGICCDNSACCFVWVDSLFFHCVGRMGIEGI